VHIDPTITEGIAGPFRYVRVTKWHIDCIFFGASWGPLLTRKPYGGTDDRHLAKEKGVDYEPPDAQPRPPRRGP